MKRRSFVQGIAATAALSLTSSFGVHRLWAVTSHETPMMLRFPADYDGATIAVVLAQSSIWPEATSETYRFGGYPGVTIRKDTGDIHSLMVNNMLTTPLAVHWHGLDVPSSMDGHPMDAITPGAMREYRFEVKNRAATYFYHSHSHERTGREVNKGLAGLFIVSDAEEKALQLPSGNRDFPLMIQDVRVDDQHAILYGLSPIDRAEGWLGNTILVNGTPNAFHVVEPAWHRVRIVNASNARIYDFKLSDGSGFVVIGGDGGLLSTPQTVSLLRLAPSERAEVLINFSAFLPGTSVTLQSGVFTVPAGHMGTSRYPQGIPLDIIRFDIVGTPDTSFQVPTALATIPPLPDVTGFPVRKWDFDMVMGPMMKHTINGRVFEMMRTDVTIPPNTTEVWEFVNKEEDMLHPIHVHGRQFRVLSRSSGPIAPHESSYKDTILLNPRETVRILITTTEYEGMFLLHCHNLEHEDEGMMLNVLISNTNGVLDEADESFHVAYVQEDNVVRVKTEEHVGAPLVIRNLQGAEVLSATMHSSDVSIDVGALTSGTYFLSINGYSKSFQLIR